MHVELFDSITKIGKKQWERIRLDYASADALFEYAEMNEQMQIYDVRYLKVVNRGNTFYCLIYLFKLSDNDVLDWYAVFIQSFFGNQISDYVKDNQKDILLVLVPSVSVELMRLYELINGLEPFFKKQYQVVFSTFENTFSLPGITYRQEPYMYFELENSTSFDAYLETLTSKQRHIIRNDRKKLKQQQIIIKEIASREYQKELHCLNGSCVYPLPEEVIGSLPMLETKGACRTMGFFRNNQLVQYVSVLSDGKYSFTIAGNISKDLRQWSGIVNAYTVFLETSIKQGCKRAYIGYECAKEKRRRGAKDLYKYLYLPFEEVN